MSAREDVSRLLAVAKRIAGDEALVTRLVESTGLSRENVVLGLAHHLETNATEARVGALVSATTPATHVHVLLSSSVFVAPLRAIALGLAAGARVTVKPSRREPCFARALVDAYADERVAIADDASVADIANGEIHVYGRDETIANVRRAARAGVIVRGHGAGMGIAIVTGNLDAAAEALARDVVVFDQRGCLSPRVAFVVGDADDFGRRLFDALEALDDRIPRGALDPSEAEAVAMWSSTVAYAGALHRGTSCAVGISDERVLPPSGRHVLVQPLRAMSDLTRALGDDARYVIAVGSDATLDVVRAAAPPRARISALGEMQRPPLDGPVDRRGD